MSRKEEESSAISLFSFQDIITSITGIMFLVVLLLVIIMITSHLPSGDPQKDKIDSTALQQELAELKKAIKAIQDNNLQIDAELDKLKKLSPAELAKRKQQLQIQINKTQQEITDLETRLAQDTRQLELTKDNILNAQLRTKAQDDSIMELQQKLAQLTRSLQAKKHALRQKERLIRYVISHHGNKTPLLLEMSKKGLRMLDVSSGTITDWRTDGSMDQSLNKLRSFLQTSSGSMYYFSVAVQPGAFAYADKVLQMLKTAGFERGIEILPDDNKSILEETKP